MENERLQRQLLLLQEQKIISTNRRKDNREGMPAQPVPKVPQKAPAMQQSLSKWVQTNPVPLVDASSSALPPAKDYASKRKQAKRDLDERWGAGEENNYIPTVTGNQASTGVGGGKNAGKPKHPTNQTQPQEQHPSPRKLDTVQSLRPDRRLDTIEEAAYDEEYDPDQPLDINLVALSSRQNKVLYPYKPNVGSVVVKSERPYGRVDFYGRELDKDGNFVKESGVEIEKPKPPQVSLKPKEDRFPYYRTHLAGQRLGFYEHHLRELFQRSEDLIFQDTYYYNLHRNRKRRTTDEDEMQSLYSPRKPRNPPLTLDEVNDSNEAQGESEDSHDENSGGQQKNNASAQTNSEELALMDSVNTSDNLDDPQPGTSTAQTPRQQKQKPQHALHTKEPQSSEPQAQNQNRQMKENTPEKKTRPHASPNTQQRYPTVAEVYGSNA